MRTGFITTYKLLRYLQRNSISYDNTIGNLIEVDNSYCIDTYNNSITYYNSTPPEHHRYIAGLMGLEPQAQPTQQAHSTTQPRTSRGLATDWGY